jgi:integrase/recombinase XerD
VTSSFEFEHSIYQELLSSIIKMAYWSFNTPRKIDTRIESSLKDFNEDLKEMAEAVGWERKFTSYFLRHGFATHLRNNKVDISIMKEVLGHKFEEQTIVYLNDLDDQPVAGEINRALSFTGKKTGKAKRKGWRI